MAPKKQPQTQNLKQGANPGGSGQATVGYTYFNDPPPGAGGLNNSEYCFAELGTATRAGSATGVGNLAKALGLPGELPMGAQVSAVGPNGQTITAVKRDRGYGQGGDGIHSDPHYAIDWWDGSSYGGKNPMQALGLSGGSGTVSVGYGGAVPGAAAGSGGPPAAGASGGGGSPIQVLTDILTGNIADLATVVATAAVNVVKEIGLGFADWVIIPWWHWNQRAVDYYLNEELFTKDESKWTVFPWTAAFWGLGYWLFWTDPDSGGLKAAPVRNSRIARHTRTVQGIPARRSLIKPKDVQGKTPKKPKPVMSRAVVTQTDTMKTSRPERVRVSGNRINSTEDGSRSQIDLQRERTASATEGIKGKAPGSGGNPPPTLSDSEHRAGDRPRTGSGGPAKRHPTSGRNGGGGDS